MTIEQTRWWLLAMALLVWPLSSLASVGGGVSGYWYNPEQSGHGLSVTVPDLDRGIAIWHVYDEQGHPLTLYLDGEISGRSLSGTVYAPTGMVFGEFDPATLEMPVWGTAEIRFDDCQTASLSWQSEQVGFASGDMGLQRLAMPVGMQCAMPVENPIAPGIYHGERLSEGSVLERQQLVVGMVDESGRFWLGQEVSGGVSLRRRHPYRSAIAIPTRVIAENHVELKGLTAWYPLFSRVESDSLEGLRGWWQATEQEAEFQLYNGTALENSSIGFHLVSGEPIGQEWLRDIAISDLAGTFEFLTHMTITYKMSVTFNDQGLGCYSASEVAEACHSQLRLTRNEQVDGLFNVTFARAGEDQETPMTGRAWVLQDGDEQHLHIVVNNGSDHFSVFATREVGQ